MNMSAQTESTSLMAALKAATQVAHAELETLAYFEALTAGTAPLESYVGHLRALSVIHAALEHALAGSDNPTLARVWMDAMRKLPLLQQDLRFFEPRTVADIRESVDAALSIAEELRLRSAAQSITLIGSLYVLEVSILGAVTIAPAVGRGFMLSGTDGMAYLHSYGTGVKGQWEQFQQRMNALELSADERASVVLAACDFVAALKPLFATLYPFKPESKVYRVTSINPEAGRHPIPTDSREVEAALRAANLCWARFPYFELRYGQRGRRFAHSDGAWLVTLCQFDQVRINQQIQWLARILATRGMPTLLLQAKLELVFAQLIAAVPERASSYEKLSTAAITLGATRTRHMSEEQLSAIGEAFDLEVGTEWSDRYRHTGQLLACAVVDELGGIAGTVHNIEAWMTDTSRFPEKWVAAVQNALARARGYSGTPIHSGA